MVRLRPLVDRGYLTVDILDENGYLIKNVYGGIVLGGDYTNWWDGTDGEGEPASPGRYMIRARWVVGEVTCEDILEPITVTRVEIEDDPDTGRDSDDVQVQYFTNVNQSGDFEYTAIPLQIYYHIEPDSGWEPDTVKLKISNPAGEVVRSMPLPLEVGRQRISWDGRDSAGEYIGYGKGYTAQLDVRVGGTNCTAEHTFDVYEIRQGDCVYRPIGFGADHAAVLYEYTGGNRLADLQNDNNFTVMEHPGPGGVTGPSNYGNFNNWHGAFCPNALPRSSREAILEKCRELDLADIPYVSMTHVDDALIHNDAIGSPAGSDWAGTVADILEVRCDGVSEAAYEDVGTRLYGDDAWWNIMTPGAGYGSNLHKHNSGWIHSMTPGKQMDSGLTRNRADRLYMPAP